VWFVGQVGNYVAYLQPETGEFKQYTIDPGTSRTIWLCTGMVWFTGNNNRRIVRLDPATGKLTTFLMPDPVAVKDPHTMTSTEGRRLFTAQQSGVVGKLTVADGKIRLWKIGPSSARTASGSIRMTGRTSTSSAPARSAPSIRRPWSQGVHTARGRATAHRGDRRRSRVVQRLSPGLHRPPRSQNGAVEDQMPGGPASLPYAMTLDDRGQMWVAETGMQPNKLHA
jgi:virginiamycin B lyase